MPYLLLTTLSGYQVAAYMDNLQLDQNSGMIKPKLMQNKHGRDTGHNPRMQKLAGETTRSSYMQ